MIYTEKILNGKFHILCSVTHDVHVESGTDSKVKAMASDRRRDAFPKNFWKNFPDITLVLSDLSRSVIKKIEELLTKLQIFPVKSKVMQQIDVDICNLPEGDGFNI